MTSRGSKSASEDRNSSWMYGEEPVDESDMMDAEPTSASKDQGGNDAGPVVSLTNAHSIAMFNKSKIRAFLHSFHFPQLHIAEGGLYSAVLYALVDRSGAIDTIGSKRPLARSPDRTAVRMVLLGSKEMFLATYAPRLFCFDITPPSKQAWNGMQQAVLGMTQRLLNAKAAWISEGLEHWAQRTAAGIPGEQPARPQSAPPPFMYVGPESVRSPPGSESAKVYQPQSVAESRDAQVEKIAMSNLKKLGDANIPQTCATLFMDAGGHVQVILYARPNSESLGFVADEEQHLHVVRVLMSAGSVAVEHAFEQPNAMQAAVCRVMETVLQEACRNHAARMASHPPSPQAAQSQGSTPMVM